MESDTCIIPKQAAQLAVSFFSSSIYTDETGQFYSEHNDYVRRERDSMAGPRILTVLLYLSDVDSGGETKFSWMDVNVSPKVGRLVIWPSVLDGNPLDIDDRTNHEAMPVSRGQKFAANAWFHLRSVVLAAERGC